MIFFFWVVLAAPLVSSVAGDLGAVREYVKVCDTYRVKPHPDVLTALRWRFEFISPEGSVIKGRRRRRFDDHDALALIEVLKRCDSARRRVRSLSFGRGCHLGWSGAASLAGLLDSGNTALEAIDLSHNLIGPRGGTLLARALPRADRLHSLKLRNCRLKAKGVEALADSIEASATALRYLDASNNGCGFAALRHLERVAPATLRLVVYGNLVLSEVLSVCTHGAGLALASLAAANLLRAVTIIESDRLRKGVVVFSASLLACYASSTAFHASFAARHVRHVFHIFDQCAIYVLIFGTYAPIMAAVGTVPALVTLAAVGAFGVVGVCIEVLGRKARMAKRKWIQMISLSLYVAMGWATIAPPVWRDLVRKLPPAAFRLTLAGGIAYTLGVPLFARDAHLDHAIWHLFVLAGSTCHYFAVQAVLQSLITTGGPGSSVAIV